MAGLIDRHVALREMRITEEEAGKWLRFDPRRYAGGVRKAAAEVRIYAAL